MSGLKILHISDLHLGRRGREEDIWKQWQKISRLILERHPEVIIMAGDIFDNGDASIPLKNQWIIELKRLVSQGTIILLIPGNHDIRKSDAFNGLETSGAKIFKEYQVFIFKNVAFHLFPFKPGLTGVDLVRLRSQNPRRYPVEIGVCHGSYIALPQVFADLGDSQAIHLPLFEEDIKALDFDYLALGHYHNACHFTVGKTHCVYPGSIEPLSFKEQEKRQVFWIKIDGCQMEIEPEEIGCQRFYKEMTLRIQTPESSINEIQQLATKLKPCFLKIRLQGVIDKLTCKQWQQDAERILKKKDITVFWEDQTIDKNWINNLPLAKQFVKQIKLKIKQQPEKGDYWSRVLQRGFNLLRQCR